MDVRQKLAQVRRDFVAGDLRAELAQQLSAARERGRRPVSLAQWQQRLERRTPAAEPAPDIVLRFDLDSDPAFATGAADLVERLGGHASFCFRARTWQPALARGLAARGHDVQYHYEELSTLAVAHRLRDAAAVRAHLPQARDAFARTLSRLRDETGLPMRIPGAHSEWIDRRLGYSNTEILADAALRERLGVQAEVNDVAFNAPFGARRVDAFPSYLDPAGRLAGALADGTGPLALVLHPRDWRSRPAGNAGEIARRLAEGLRCR